MSTCEHPTTLDVLDGTIAVACAASDQLQWIEWRSGATETIDLPWGARPYGVLWMEDGGIVATLQGTGEVAWVTADGVVDRQYVGPDLRGLARKGEALLVSRHRSPEAGGSLYTVRGDETTLHTLAWDPGPDSDGDARGLPTYLQHIALRPDGRSATLSGLKANVERGLFNEGQPFTEESTVRSDLRQVRLTETEWGVEGTPLTLDNRDRVAASAFHPNGHLMVVVTAGAQSLEVVDPDSMRVLSGALQVGHGVRGVAVDASGGIWVDAELSRELVHFTLDETQVSPVPVRIPLTTGLQEPLSADVLAGKKLFYDASDIRLTSQGYIACASCHLDGASDHRTWDFTDRGEGVRNTPSLMGVADTGLLHWSANFDEVHDFEHDIREVQDGLGLMTDAEYAECEPT